MTATVRPPARPVLMTGLTVVFALSMAAAGCMNDKWPAITPRDLIPFLPQTSPANALCNLQMYYADRDIDRYRRLFAPDFVFVFNPSDVVDPDHPTPAKWSLADELRSTENMFADSLVSRIELTSYVLGVPERADSLSPGARAWKVRVDAANLLVTTRTENDRLLTYVVDGGTEVFFFREDPTRPASDGKPTWFIFRWEDQQIGGRKIETMSWGRIKAAYY